MESRISIILLIVAEVSVAELARAEQTERRMSCKVAKAAGPPTIDANWDKPPWRAVASLSIDRYVEEKPGHCPKTQVKITYDDAAVYAIFRVEDRYVRSVAAEHGGMVWRDSCVEWFFTPGRDIDRGYFNLEINCGGTMLLHFQKAPGEKCVDIPASECGDIRIAHSLPKIVDPEVSVPVAWTVECCLPIAILNRYCSVDKPATGVIWRANFYKCGDATSHPHWLTWSPIDVRDFHRPGFFGTLEFQ